MKRVYRFILSCTFAGVVATCGCQQTQPVKSSASQGAMREECSYGKYVARTYRGKYDGYFEILHKGRRVYAVHGNYFRIGMRYNAGAKKNNLVSMGTDITGDGKPNLVISEWTGGAHCCFLFYVFEIGHKFRHIQTINAYHSDLACFKNLDNDLALEFSMSDWSFAYWRTCFANSPAPALILKYNGKSYEMAGTLMKKPGLAHTDLIKTAVAIRKLSDWKEGRPPVKLWAKMIDLIYTGNMNQVWKLFEMSWPVDINGKEDFIKDFKTQLSSSPFWKNIQKLNKKHINNRAKSKPKNKIMRSKVCSKIFKNQE